MKFRIVIYNLSLHFRIEVYDGEKKVVDSTWKGTEFEYKGKFYALMGPYHDLKEFTIFELVDTHSDVEAHTS